MEAIGIDLVEIDRIKSALERFGSRFTERILGFDELRAYERRPEKATFLAGRFAAKEAVIKCLGRYCGNRPSYAELQILNDAGGNPVLSLSQEVNESIGRRGFQVSITHERKYAAAVAVISGQEQ